MAADLRQRTLGKPLIELSDAGGGTAASGFVFVVT
jgi:hypothetical protein